MKKLKFNKSWALSLVLTALLCTALTYALVQTSAYVHRSPKVNVNLFVIHESVSGKEEITSGNVMTNIAENNLRDRLAFGNSTLGTNMTDYLSTGNSTVAATLTKITTECDNSSAFGRKQGTVSAWYNGTDYAYNVTATWTANATVTIDTIGLNWFWSDGSDNNLFAVAAITQTAFAVSDNCTAIYVITIDAN